MRNILSAFVSAVSAERETAWKGFLGISATSFGAAVTLFQQVEALLRLGSLLVGMAVGIVTIWSIVRKTKNK